MNVRIVVLAGRKSQPRVSKLLGWGAGLEVDREFGPANLMLARQCY